MGSELARVFITTFLLLELLYDIHHYLLFPLYFGYLHPWVTSYYRFSSLLPLVLLLRRPKGSSYDFRLQAPPPLGHQEKELCSRTGGIPKYSRAEVKIVE